MIGGQFGALRFENRGIVVFIGEGSPPDLSDGGGVGGRPADLPPPPPKKRRTPFMEARERKVREC